VAGRTLALRFGLALRLALALGAFAAAGLAEAATAAQTTPAPTPQRVPAPKMVELTAPDSTKLMTTYYSSGKPAPGVLLLHQCNQQRKNWDGLATRMAAAGIHVLTLDYRGFGESSGKAWKDMAPADAAKIRADQWPVDIDIAFNFLETRAMLGIVGVGGASCGVNQAIQVARRHPEVKSLVLLSGSTDREGRQLLRKPGSLPVLAVAADDDDNVVEVMQWLYGISANPGSRFEHYATGGHGTEMFAAHPELPGMIVDWYVQTLLKTPGNAPAVRGAAEGARAPGILELIDSPGGSDKAGEQLAAARRRDPKANLFSEGVVNILGYEHLQAGDTKGAIEILRLNAGAYPNSPNVYDSLSDAYLANGQKDAALENAKKALELLASDRTDPEAQRKAIRQSAEDKMKQLGATPQ
jgi:dienelactone hydrolase